MIKSMTGFGIAQIELEDLTVKAEIKSLNGKQFDCSVKLPNSWRNFELELRNVISEKIIRGKVDCLISLERKDSSSATNIKEESFINTYNYLLSLAHKVKADTSGLLEYVLCLPDLRNNESQMTEEEQKQTLLSVVNTALEELNRFRETEGKRLEKDFENRIGVIAALLEKVPLYEQARCARIKERLYSNLKELDIAEIDENRLEQEMIYYMEKLDITEEKVRLRQHMDYFLECMSKEETQGKKLGFITQEMGREINTLGSKANDADLQMIVVKMKDELEKIKEQLANIL